MPSTIWWAHWADAASDVDLRLETTDGHFSDARGGGLKRIVPSVLRRFALSSLHAVVMINEPVERLRLHSSMGRCATLHRTGSPKQDEGELSLALVTGPYVRRS